MTRRRHSGSRLPAGRFRRTEGGHQRRAASESGCKRATKAGRRPTGDQRELERHKARRRKYRAAGKGEDGGTGGKREKRNGHAPQDGLRVNGRVASSEEAPAVQNGSICSNCSCKLQRTGPADGRVARKDDGRADRKDDGRADRKDDGRADRKDDGRADRKDDGRADRKDDGRADRKDDGRADRKDDGRADKTADGRANKSANGLADEMTDSQADKIADGQTDKMANGRVDKSPDNRVDKSPDKTTGGQADGSQKKHTGKTAARRTAKVKSSSQLHSKDT